MNEQEFVSNAFCRECILCQKHIFLLKKHGGFTTSCDKLYNFTETTFLKNLTESLGFNLNHMTYMQLMDKKNHTNDL